MTKTFDEITGEDVFDIRDIIERFEELRTDKENFENWEKENPDENEEFNLMASFLEEVKGNGGDEQWEGDWYPVTFIKDGRAFEDYMDQMLEDCGDMQAYDKIPAYLTITVDYDMLKQDYTSVKIGNDTYLYR